MTLFLLLMLVLFAQRLFSTATRLLHPYPYYAPPVSRRRDVIVLVAQLLLLVWVLVLLVSAL